jgi:hypothetical protein
VLERKELTLDEFEVEFRSAAAKRITVRLSCETPAAKRHFDQWLREMRGRHLSEAHARQLLQMPRKRIACRCAH